MTKKHDNGQEKEQKRKDGNGLSRRDFVKTGAAVGLGAAVLSGPALAQAPSSGAGGIVWDYDVDVVVLGSGCVGLASAVRARDLGSRVLVVEQSFDVGGKLLHSGGWTTLGGGDAIQERDRAGEDGGLGLTKPLVPPEDLEDDPDRLFRDVTDWSVTDSAGVGRYRYNDRELHRAWADNTASVRQFLLDNNVNYARINGTHWGGGMTRGRAARPIIKLGDVTDIRAGTLSPEDRGDPANERHSIFSPMRNTPGVPGESVGAPGYVYGGFVIARALEFNARAKGVKFMVNRHMDEIIREEQFSGKVLGIKASYTPRFNPNTGERLESFSVASNRDVWRDGNIDERRETVYIRAKAVIVGTGGMQGSLPLRTMMDPRMSEPSIIAGPDSLMGPLIMDGSGVIAGMRIGANLAGMMQNYQHQSASCTISSTLGTRNVVGRIFPGHPSFLFAKAKGISIGNDGWEHVIVVNQVGKRFYNESAIPASTGGDGTTTYPPGRGGTKDPFVAEDWRNCSVEHIKAAYSRTGAIDAALAMNEGSRPPDYSSGPLWAIFDADAVKRGDWQIRYPFIADPPDEYFHSADTIGELVDKVMKHPHQRGSLKYLEETVARYNEAAGKGTDDDFEKPVMHKIGTPPLYAAFAAMTVNDSNGGLRINGKTQVVDTQGQVIPRLYAGGEASGGGAMHGLGRALTHGYMAGTQAAKEA